MSTATLERKKKAPRQTEPSSHDEAIGVSVIPTQSVATSNGNGHRHAEFVRIDLSQIIESSTNPRKVFHGLEALADSIRVHDVIEPVLVRKIGAIKQCYELVAGARRYRASKLAGKTEIPAIVRELSDKDALEIQVIENDQREDVQPLDQAMGYKALIEKADYDVPSLAAKIGRSESYVYERLSLTKLIKPLQDLLASERIHFGHARLLCRLTEKDQKEMAEGLKRDTGYSIPSIGRLKDEIERQYHLDLHSAPFAKDAADLVAGCGPCTTCSKRTGFNPALFPDVAKKDTCTDRACFQAKQAAHVQLAAKRLEEKGEEFVQISTSWYGEKKAGVLTADKYQKVTRKEAKSLPADEVKKALVVDGEGVGQVVQVRLHKSGGSSDSNDSYKREQKKREAKARLRKEVHNAILDRILQKIDSELSLPSLRMVARFSFDSLYHDGQKLILKRRDWTVKPNAGGEGMQKMVAGHISQMDAVELHRFVVETALARHVPVSPWSSEGKLPEEMKLAAEHYKVDVKKVTKDTIAAAKAATPAKKAKAAAKSKASKIQEVDDEELLEAEEAA